MSTYVRSSIHKIYPKTGGPLSPVHTMKLLSATGCCRQKFHGVYVRETCFKRFFMVHETVSSNRTLLYFLKLVCNFSRLLANHSSAIYAGQFTCNSCKWVYTIKKGVKCLQINSTKVFQALWVLISKFQSMVSPIYICSLNPSSCPATSYYLRSI